MPSLRIIPSLIHLSLLAVLLALISGKPLHAQSLAEDGFNPPFEAGTVEKVGITDQGKILAVGHFDLGAPGEGHVARLHPNGWLDEDFSVKDLTISTGTVLDFAQLHGEESFLIGGTFTGAAQTDYLVKLDAVGKIDASFNLAPNAPVFAFAREESSSIYIGGAFTEISGHSTARIARLINGVLDTSFAPPAFNGSIRAILPLPDNTLLVAGDNLQINGNPAAGSHLFRLRPTGEHDDSFVFDRINPTTGIIHALAYQLDGKIFIGGDFTMVPPLQAISHLARLNPDGDYDPTFSLPASPDAPVRSLARQPDGKIIAGGDFSNLVPGSAALVRLNQDGTIDMPFSNGMLPDEPVTSVAVQGDGGVLFSGGFRFVGDHVTVCIARIRRHLGLDLSLDALPHPIGLPRHRPDGNLLFIGQNYPGLLNLALGTDGSLLPYSYDLDDAIVSGFADMMFQPDEKLIAIGGGIQLRDGGARGSLRLDANGVLDPTYNPPDLVSTSLAGIPPQLGGGFETFGHSATLLELDRHGRIYLGGSNFDPPQGYEVAEGYRPKIMRLEPDGSRDHNFIGGSLYNPRVDTAFRKFKPQVIAMTMDWDQEKLIFTESDDDELRFNTVSRKLPNGGNDQSFFMWLFKELSPSQYGWRREISSFQPLPGNRLLMGGFFEGFASFGYLTPETPFNYTQEEVGDLVMINEAGRQEDIDFKPFTHSGTLYDGNPGFSVLDRYDPVDYEGNRGIRQIVGDQTERIYVVSHKHPQLGNALISLNGDPLNGIFRLLPNGERDFSFTHRPGYEDILNIIPQPDGKLLVQGGFTSIDGVARPGVARLGNLDSIPEETLIRLGNGDILWQRRFAGPLTASRPQLYLSYDGENFEALPGHMNWETANGGNWVYHDLKHLPVAGTYYLKTRAQLAAKGGLFESPVHQFSTGQANPPTTDLALDMSVSPIPVVEGDDVTFVITASNHGPASANGVVVRQFLPDGYDFISATPSTGSYNPSTGAWSLGTLAAGNDATLTVTATALRTIHPHVIALDYVNRALIRGNVRDNSLANNEATATPGHPLPTPTDLGVTITPSPAEIAVGDTVEMTITVTNHGPARATAIRAPFRLPNGFQTIPNLGSIPNLFTNGSTRDLVWVVGELESGESDSITFEIESNSFGWHNPFTVNVEAFEPDPNPDNNTASAIIFVNSGNKSDLVVTLEIDNPDAQPGETVQVIATVTNLGPDNSINTYLYVPLPDGLTFINAVPGVSGGSYSAASGRWTFDTIIPSPANSGPGFPNTRTMTLNATVNANASSYTIEAITYSTSALAEPASATASLNLTPGVPGAIGSLSVFSVTPVPGNQREIVLHLVPTGPGNPVLEQSTDLGDTDPWSPVPTAIFTSVPENPGVLETTVTRPNTTDRLFFRASIQP